MAFTIDHYNTFLSSNWKFNNMLGKSRIAVLFPNELRQDGGAFKSTVQFPVMTEVKLQDSWEQKTGFNEEDATEEIVQIELVKNFTSYTKIAKVNVPADWQTWATGKIKTIQRQEARELDDFVLLQIIGGVLPTNTIEDEAVTKDNVVAMIKKLAKIADKNKFRLEDAILFGSTEVATAITNSKISNVSQNLENTSVVVNKILNKYNFVEVPIEDAGFQMIALLPSAFAWASAVEIPLMSGEYTQGKYLGQLFTAINKFYNGKVLMENQIVGLKLKEDGEGTDPNSISKTQSTIDSSLTDFKNMIFLELSENYVTKKEIENLEQKIQKAKSIEELVEIKNNPEIDASAMDKNEVEAKAIESEQETIESDKKELEEKKASNKNEQKTSAKSNNNK